MAETTTATVLHGVPFGRPRAAFLRGFRRLTSVVEDATAPAAAEEPAFEPDTAAQDFECFGRSGLQLGGLYRDRQWVGAWGGRC